MATVVNAGDLALQNVSPRILNTTLTVSTSDGIITTNEDGSVTPSSFVLTVNRTLGFGTSSTRSWSYANTNAPGTFTSISSSTTLDTITVTNNNFITYKGTTANGVIFKCTVSQAGFPDNYADITVTNNVLASNTILASLTFPSYALTAASATVSPGSYPTGNAIRLYRGATLLTSGVTYNVGGVGALQTKNGLTLTTDGSGNLTLSGGSWTTTTETFTVNAVFNSATYSAGLTVTKALTGATGTNGSNGGTGATGTRGNLTVNLGGGWNSSTADSLIANAASSAGSTPTTPINGDVAYYTGGAFVRSGGSWTTASAFIDGSLVVTGTLAADKITAGSTISAGVSINSSGYIKATGTSSTTVPALGASTWVGSFSSVSADYGLYANGVYGGIYGYGNGGFGVRGNAGGASSVGVIGVGSAYGVSGLGGTYGALCAGTDTDLHLNTSPVTTATSTATYIATKPGSTSGNNSWYKIKLGGSPLTYYIPVWIE